MLPDFGLTMNIKIQRDHFKAQQESLRESRHQSESFRNKQSAHLAIGRLIYLQLGRFDWGSTVTTRATHFFKKKKPEQNIFPVISAWRWIKVTCEASEHSHLHVTPCQRYLLRAMTHCASRRKRAVKKLNEKRWIGRPRRPSAVRTKCLRA